MIPLSKIITEFENKYFDKYDQSILPSHKKALQVMKRCRSEISSYMLVQCSDPECEKIGFIPHSDLVNFSVKFPIYYIVTAR